MLRNAVAAASRLTRNVASRNYATQKEPLRVAVTGPAGNIGYALLFRIASGGLFGPDQPVILHCIELPHAMNALKGTAMEIKDAAFPLVKGIVETDNLEKGFEGVDAAILVGAKPRGPGMERADLLKDNGAIFKSTGAAMDKTAKKTCKTVVVGNPANTNALILAHHAPSIPVENFTAMTRLDHNRALAQLSDKSGKDMDTIRKLVIWGNHSPTMYPDINNCTIDGVAAKDALGDNVEEWLANEFRPRVQKRGAEIIEVRGASSAASAGSAAVDHIHDWFVGNPNNDWVSMGVISDGSYNIPKDLMYSVPVTCKGDGSYDRVTGLEIDSASAALMEKTANELISERDAVAHLL